MRRPEVAHGTRSRGRDERADHWSALRPEFVRTAAADRLRALGHPDRLRVIEVLAQGPKNVTEIASTLALPNATVSRHLKVLHDALLVEKSRHGNHVLYVLADREVGRLAAVAYRGAGERARRLRADAPPR